MVTKLNIIIFITAIYGIFGEYDECIFTDTGGTGYKLNLNELLDVEITAKDMYADGSIYQYSACRNEWNCTYHDVEYLDSMVKRTNPDGSCGTTAHWDYGKKQPIYNDNKKLWTFQYENGNLCTYMNGSRLNRTLQLMFFCDIDVEYQLIYAQEPTRCVYQFIIQTRLACLDYNSSNNNNDPISAGTLFLILLLIFVVAYWFIGLIIGRCKTIPHRDFWCNLPKLVTTGCNVSRENVVTGVQGGGGSRTVHKESLMDDKL